MQLIRRDVVAGLIAPIGAPLVYALIATSKEPGWIVAYGSMPQLGVVTLLSYASFLVLAMPAIVLLNRFAIYSVINVAIAGFVAGMAVLYAFYRWTGLMFVSLDFSYTELLWGGLHGLAVGLLFCLISGRK